MHLEIKQGDSGLWYVALVGGNGETMMYSELYNKKWNAVRAAVHISEVTNLDIVPEPDPENDPDLPENDEDALVPA